MRQKEILITGSITSFEAIKHHQETANTLEHFCRRSSGTDAVRGRPVPCSPCTPATAVPGWWRFVACHRQPAEYQSWTSAEQLSLSGKQKEMKNAFFRMEDMLLRRINGQRIQQLKAFNSHEASVHHPNIFSDCFSNSSGFIGPHFEILSLRLLPT